MIRNITISLVFAVLSSVVLNAKDVRLELSQLVNQAFEQEEAKGSVVNLSALNKMLSQRMAKDAILVAHDIDVAFYQKDFVDSAKQFNDFIEGMYNGNDALKLPKETDPNIIKELDEVNAVWKDFYVAVQNFDKDRNKEGYDFIINNNEKLMRLSHKLTQSLQSKNILNTHDNRVIVHTLQFADRQRMLTQKMFKEKFLIYTKENAEQNNVRLRGSIILFKNGLEGLINGQNKRGLAKVTNKAIQAKLQEMYVLYQEVEDIYKKQHVELNELKDLAEIDKKMMELSVDVVNMIEDTLVY